MFSSHWYNYEFSNSIPQETSYPLIHAKNPEKNVFLETESNKQPTGIALNLSDSQPSTKKSFNWMIFFKLVWMIGFILFTFKWIYQIKNIYLIKKQARIMKASNNKFKIYWSQLSEVPFLFVGKFIFIIIPEHMQQWPKENIKHIIKHEKCHYHRKDHWVLWISVLTKSVFWFHPFIHILAKKQQHLIELACDQQLLASGADPISYAETLLSCVYNCEQDRPVVAMANKPSQIKIRISSLL